MRHDNDNTPREWIDESWFLEQNMTNPPADLEAHRRTREWFHNYMLALGIDMVANAHRFTNYGRPNA